MGRPNLNMDRYSHKIIVSNLELFLDYCLRYYDRQFYTRGPHHQNAITLFESHLISYFQTDT
ncbi:MAG: AraC family transcriptional regulator, partial [Bacteroidota bacterium]